MDSFSKLRDSGRDRHHNPVDGLRLELRHNRTLRRRRRARLGVGVIGRGLVADATLGILNDLRQQVKLDPYESDGS